MRLALVSVVPALTENHLDLQRLQDLLWKGNITQISSFPLTATSVEMSTILTMMLKRLKGESIDKGVVLREKLLKSQVNQYEDHCNAGKYMKLVDAPQCAGGSLNCCTSGSRGPVCLTGSDTLKRKSKS